jgi:hypothetical protein
MAIEVGFWDYTCPKHGSIDKYTKEDWDILLDDIAEGEFKSLVLGVKWLTTGYRSRYSWLDQDSEAATIASDNQTLHYALQEARKRGIQTWLLVVGTIFATKPFGPEPPWKESIEFCRDFYKMDAGYYDLDHPGLLDRMTLLLEEVVELFGEYAHGIVVELEFCDRAETHRIPLYNEWAQKNNRPSFDEIKKIDLQPRSFPFSHWRDFTTERRIVSLTHLEAAIRKKGFQGELSTINEMENSNMVVIGNTNLNMLSEQIPNWSLVTYDGVYDRRLNRRSSMEFCIDIPKQLGFDVNYLSRGVMTFLEPRPLLDEWRMIIEDAIAHQPKRLWFMGADAQYDGAIVNKSLLPQWGFDDGRTARLALMAMAKKMELL